MQNNLIEASKVAENFNVTPNNLYAKIRAGFFPESVIFRLGKRRLYFKENELNNWIEQGGGKPTC